ncbi:MAG: glycosyltransferase 87 family protein [Vicinamibacterales bacterium]
MFRPILMLGAVFLVLFAVYAPAVNFFRCVGDVLLYQEYARGVLAQPVQWPREYPALSAAIFVLPQLATSDAYVWGFACLAGVTAWVMMIVVDRISGRGWWLAGLFFLGAAGTVFFRYDVFVALATVLAFAAASRQRWLVAQALLGIGIALKIYPAILMPLVVVWEWQVTRRVPLRSALGGALLALAAVGGTGLLGGWEQVATMARYQSERPLELGSLGASIAWALGTVEPEFSFGSWNFASSWSPVLIPLLSALGLILLLAVYAAFAFERLAPASAWALVLLITLCTSKVLSPQYLIWVLPFVAMAMSPAPDGKSGTLDERWLWAAICVLTAVIYPLTFEPWVSPTLREQVVPVWWIGLVGVRNALLVVATLWGIFGWRVPAARRVSV